MGLLLLTGFALVSSLLVLYLHGRMNERTAWREWTDLLEGRSEAVYRAARDHLDDRLTIVDCAYDRAYAAHKTGSMDEAIEFLGVGYDMVEAVAPDLQRLLAGMAALSRMAVAIAPVPPVRPADFRTAGVVNLAQLGALLHVFLVSTKERLRLRLFILGRGITLVTRWLFLWTQRIRQERTAAPGPWQEIQSLQHDFRKLSDESLESLRVLLLSIGPSASPSQIPPADPRGRPGDV
jgi:hypothetical protein